jgi:transcriptional regulator with XRE-family HTH domain
MTSKPLAKLKRERGVILTPQGWHKLQQAKQEAEAKHNWSRRFTHEQLSERTGLSLHTISRILLRKEGVDKQSLECFLSAFSVELSTADCTRPVPLFPELEARQGNPQRDWGEALDVSVFYGRSPELAQLRQWLLEDRCRLVAVLGIGGIGKSTLAVKLALQAQMEFEVVVWRSLQKAPLLEELLGSILQSLMQMQGENSVLPVGLDSRLSKLMESLRRQRCLLILDNAETILGSGSRAGQYRVGYEGYGQLLRCIGEVPHQSSLILTSREKPREIALLEGEKAHVRSLQLRGLKPAQGRELFRDKGQFTGTEAEWNELIEHYAGNPLALKLVAAATQELFDGRIAAVLQYVEQGILVFNDIRDLLERQFQRLSAVEQEVMYWLAIGREPVPLAELGEDIVTTTSKRKLPEAINFLLRRSLIEKSGDQLSLQPVMMKYVTERLVEQVCAELVGEREKEKEKRESCPLFQTHALMKATAKDYVRATQRRLILQPVIEQLLTQLGSQRIIEQRLQELLLLQREQLPQQLGYVGGNILNLLVQLKTDLRALDFSEIAVWQADLRQVNLAGVNFQNADLAKSVFAET